MYWFFAKTGLVFIRHETGGLSIYYYFENQLESIFGL